MWCFISKKVHVKRVNASQRQKLQQQDFGAAIFEDPNIDKQSDILIRKEGKEKSCIRIYWGGVVWCGAWNSYQEYGFVRRWAVGSAALGLGVSKAHLRPQPASREKPRPTASTLLGQLLPQLCPAQGDLRGRRHCSMKNRDRLTRLPPELLRLPFQATILDNTLAPPPLDPLEWRSTRALLGLGSKRAFAKRPESASLPCELPRFLSPFG